MNEKSALKINDTISRWDGRELWRDPPGLQLTDWLLDGDKVFLVAVMGDVEGDGCMVSSDGVDVDECMGDDSTIFLNLTASSLKSANNLFTQWFLDPELSE